VLEIEHAADMAEMEVNAELIGAQPDAVQRFALPELLGEGWALVGRVGFSADQTDRAVWIDLADSVSGSVSRHTIDRLAPFIAQLYRSKELIGFLENLTGDKLLLSPADDPHAYALYYYTKPGDHIGWHYDTSYYDGRRYTLLLGVIDESSCRLDYELHTRDPNKADLPGSVQIPPGGLVFFDGDKLRHRITPALENEMRVSLTFEYVTDPNMRPWRRVISNFKDAIAYFGFRQVFSQFARRNAKGEGA